jgi:uncharacterized protein YegP (UPF0339 family)
MTKITHTIEIYKSNDGFRAKVKASNGEIIFHNAQGIANKSDLVQTVNNFLESVRNSTIEIKDLTK